MKTTMIARCVFASAAIFAAAGLIGCGAEQGSEGSEGIGVTSQALTGTPVVLASAPTSLTASQSPLQERKFASSCKLKDGSTEYLVVAGGFSSSGTAKSDIILSQVGGAWTTQAATLSVARGDGRMIAISDTRCVFVGGATSPSGATAQATVDVLDLVHGTPDTIAVNSGISPHALQQARSNFEISTCTETAVGHVGDLHLVVFGGLAAGGSPAELRDIEVSPVVSTLNNAWTQSTSKLQIGRYNFGLAKEKSTPKYLAAAGVVTFSARDNTMDLITLSSTCAFSTAHATATNLPDALDGNVSFFEGTADTFIVSSGRYEDNNANVVLYPSAQKVLVTNWSTGAVTITAANSPSAGTYRPVLVNTDPTNQTAHLLLGGSNAAISAPVTTVQEYLSGTWASASTALSPGVYGAIGEFFPLGNKVITATGTDFSTPLPLTVQGYTP